ncbi:hypothetical protein SAMN05518672_104360 [Chitinophaga sp. CF118]|uniref:hypothetical protein n=1 Tax=Chitinophaga sp. CF118 TaxID=1884367 RepID=UPI0008E0398F|nr:hypothetical protein [Chitinophaga sp. CF118]SFE06872.1 hypothetical protein SAMN05518672_104360 [Chitinophaga sp. CF118]
MQKTLLTRGYKPIISLILLLLAFKPPAMATPECPIITGTFPFVNGTTISTAADGWYLDATKVVSSGYFAVKSNRIMAENLGGEGIWYSNVFSVAGYSDFQAAVKITAEGNQNSSEYVKIYYRINGGAETLLDQRTGNFGTIDFTSPVLTGSTIQLIVKLYNYNNGSTQTSKYYIEEYRVFKENGPCASAIPVTAVAGNNGTLTCANSSLTLSASSSASNVTYRWTGPNSFTSTAQNPVVSTAGTYTVVGTNSTGSGSDIVVVTENKVVPDISATGGSLACFTSVTLNANTSVANATYSWTGPNSFTSAAKNPTVSTAGTYVVTVKNPVNGCTASQSVTVTSGTAAQNAFWTEDFTLSDGVTSDNGTTSFTSTKPFTATLFSVLSNAFRASNTGLADAVWTSGVVNIAGKTNVKVSADCRSSVLNSSVVMNDSGELVDYLRFYYKLNGGAEVLFGEKLGSINSHSTTYSNVSLSGLSGNTIQIVVRARATGNDEFYYFDNVKMAGVDPAVTLTTAVSRTVTCANSAQITVTPSSTVSSYSWTGPNGFTSTLQNPTVTAGGQYIVTATLPSGCTVSAPVTVAEDKAAPDLSASGGSLGCQTSIVINASTSVASPQYSWSGPNGFTSTLKSPTVNTAGTYTVTVTNPANGCTATQSVQVSSGAATPSAFWWEDFTLANGTTVDNGATSWTVANTGSGTYSVQNNEFKVSYSSAAEGVWSSGVVDISSKKNIVISVDLRSETASSNDAFESDDYIRVYYKLNGGAETLAYEDFAGIGATNTTGTASFSFSSAALNGSTLQVIVKTRNSDVTERYFFDNVKLTGTDVVNVDATAAVSGPLTCSTTTVTLTGSSTIPGATYSWTGPNSFTSALQNPTVTVPGAYTLIVTAPGSGCTANATATVLQNITVPVLTVTKPDTLSCTKTAVNLIAASTTASAVISWTGFTTGQKTVSVSAPGKYYVTAKDTINGCTTKDSVTVIQSITVPNLTVTAPGIINCTTPAVNLTAASTTTGAVISWTGFTAGQNPVSVSAPGKYYVTASSTNGCTKRDSVTVTRDTTKPTLTVTAPAALNCSTTTVSLTAASTTTGAVISWTGFTAGQNPVSVSAPGKYYVTVKGTNGCTKQDSVTVTQDVSKPSLTVTTPGIITCTTPTVNLTATSATSGVTITWTGFTAGQGTVSVSAAGKYYVTAKTTNNCSSTDSVTVTQDISIPVLTVTAPGVLSCATPVVNLTAASTTTGAVISWTGFTAGQNPVSVSAPGKYYVTAKTANGCTKLDSVTVTQNSTIPNLTVTAPGNLNCTTTTVNLTAASTTTGVTITWTGFTAGQNPVSVSAPGKYYVTAKSSNGCTKIDSVTVVQDVVKPSLTVTTSGTLNCTTSSITLSATSATSGATITWTGFTTGQNVINVSTPGKYYVTAVASSGCSTKDSVTVTQDIAKPNLSVATPGIFSCSTVSVSLSASSTTTGTTITWLGFAAGQNPVTVYAPGKYYVTAKNTLTGCITSDSVTVTQENNKPDLTISPVGKLNCNTPFLYLTASSSTSGATITWSGFSPGQNQIMVFDPGTYYVTVRTSSGCFNTDSVKVVQDLGRGNMKIQTPGIISCVSPFASLNVTGTDPGAVITWAGFQSGQNNISVNDPGTYYVTVRGANGCLTMDSVKVIQDVSKPLVTITQAGTLSCSSISVNLTAASVADAATITWAGNAAGQNTITVYDPGTYYVTVRGGNGCINRDSVKVIPDTIKPVLTITKPDTLSCAVFTVNLTAATTTPGATITWGGFAAGQNPVTVSTPGTYYVTVRGTNGCQKTESVVVAQKLLGPGLSVTQPEILTCAKTSVSLTATSTATGLTISWTGFPAGQNPVSVSAPGKYYVTARTSTGCTTIDSVIVTQDITKPNLTTTAPATLTCATTTVSLAAASTTTGTVISWTGFPGFPAGQNPVNVSAPGKYYVTARSTTGCTTIDSVIVNQDVTKPDLSVTEPAILTCGTTTVNLTAESTTAGAIISWTGFPAGQNPVSVSAPGKYYVTARSTTGCTRIDSVTVNQDITKPNLSVTAPATLTCARTTVSLTATSATPDAIISWTGFVTGENPVNVSAPGKYYVTARSITGCTTIDSVTVIQDFSKPNLTTTAPATLTCATTTVSLTAASTTTGATITWTGFTVGQNPVSVSAPGKYYVTARSTTGCTTIDSVTVTQDITKPNLTTTAPATLTCATTTVSLTAASTTTGAIISWTGFPAGQNPVSVSAPGKYYVTARNTTGCTRIDSVTVNQDITKPNLSITAPATLTCGTATVSLTAASTTTGAIISWTGFPAGQNPVSVSAPGKYYVTARSTTGCTTIDSVTVNQDITKPNLSVTAPATLTCATTTVSLTAASTTTGVTITWTGFPAGQNPVSISAPGKYYVTARSTTGCTTIDSVTVNQDITKPNLSVTAPASLTCAATTVSLTAASTTTGTTISWTGFPSGQNPVSVSAPGKYYVTARSTTGCTTIDSVTVTQDITKPNLTTTAPAILTCATTTVSLTAASTTTGATISWTGFPAGQNPVSVSAPGKYYVTARSTTGCTTIDSVTVTQDITKPNLTTTAPATLTCGTTTVSLTAASTTTGTTISWTGFPAGQNPVSVSAPGKYYVTVRSATGCATIDSVTVTQDITKPNLTTTAPAILTCGTTTVNLTAASTTTGTTISWTGFPAGQNPVSVSAPGKYYVTARSTTGCTTIDSVTVTQDITKPNLSTTTPAILTCATTTVSLNAASTTTGAIISWTGFPAGQNPVSISAPGKYYVTARSTTGCTTIDSVTVTQDITKPNLTITAPAILTCATTSISLTAASTTTGTTISWTGFPAGQNPVSVSAPGKYYVTARSLTGCVNIDSVTVLQDITKPNLTTTTPATLTCSATTINLTAASTTTGATISWTGFPASQNPVGVSAPGKYYVTARSTSGCTTIDSVIVKQDITKPNLTTTTPATLTCAETTISLIAASSTTGTSITWTGFPVGQNPVSVSAPGKFYVTARSANDCITIDSVMVLQDVTKPTLTTTAPATLTCATTSVSLSATSTGATISWSGFPAGQNPVSVSAPGKYYVSARSTTGCITVDSVTVNQDITKPVLTVTTPSILTCGTTSVSLSATSTGATISWSGFTAGQNPVSVSAPGKYYVTARSATGCITVDSVTVTQDITKPNLSVTAPATLTCATTTVSLNAASTTTGAIISWTGFAAGQNPVSVSAPGKYYVTARSASGCTTIDSVTVTQNIAKPTLLISTPAILTCATTSISLQATSTTGVTITWTGFPAGQNPVTISAPGKYYVTARNTIGCTSIDSVEIIQDIAKPILTVNTPATLTCATTSVNLQATSADATISWTGFPAGQNPVIVSAPGKYYVTARSETGCTSIDSVTVTQDITKPNLSVTAPATLTCATTTVSLNAASTTTGATISWTGFPAGQNPVSISAPGKYYVTARSTTGCTTIDSVTVNQDITKPNLSITAPATLTCATTTVSLNAASTTTGATIRWTGFSAGENPVSISAPGKYYVTARSTTGCTTIDSVTVNQDITKPNLSITAPATLTCATTTVSLNAASTTTGATIRWTGFSAGENPVSISAPGKYYVTARSTTGCTTIDSVTVTQDITKPNLSITAPATLTCATTTVSLNALSTTTGATIRWTGFSAGENPVSISAPGKYYVTARSTTGCTTIDSVTVNQDITKPNLSVTPPVTLTCATPSINLTAASATTGATISWTGFTTGVNPVSISAPGKYYVTARSTTGCTTIDSVTVIQNITKPSVTVTKPATLTCIVTSVNLEATSPGNTITWTGFTAGQNPVSVGAPGKYYVTVKSSANGCLQVDSVTVVRDKTAPEGVTAGNTGNITCNKPSTNITANSTTTGVTYAWSGPNNFTSNNASAAVTVGGVYNLLVVNTATGCSVSANTTVTKNTTLPVTIINPPTAALSPLSFDVLTARSVTGASYKWTLTSDDPNWTMAAGAASAILTYMSGEEGSSGTFKLKVTDNANGCSDSAQLVLTVPISTVTETIEAETSAFVAAPAAVEPVIEYNAYPNPFTERAYITFKSPVTTKVTVEIFGYSGASERILYNDLARGGESYKLVFNPANLPSGMHYCVIRTNGKVYATRLLLVR